MAGDKLPSPARPTFRAEVLSPSQVWWLDYRDTAAAVAEILGPTWAGDPVYWDAPPPRPLAVDLPAVRVHGVTVDE